MTPVASTGARWDRLLALERANEIRCARAELKQRLRAGEVSAAEVILVCPVAARNWPVGELLASQQQWGRARRRTFLADNRISEVKSIGELTERQRHLLAAQLARCREAQAGPVEASGARRAGRASLRYNAVDGHA